MCIRKKMILLKTTLKLYRVSKHSFFIIKVDVPKMEDGNIAKERSLKAIEKLSYSINSLRVNPSKFYKKLSKYQEKY